MQTPGFERKKNVWDKKDDISGLAASILTLFKKQKTKLSIVTPAMLSQWSTLLIYSTCAVVVCDCCMLEDQNRNNLLDFIVFILDDCSDCRAELQCIINH